MIENQTFRQRARYMAAKALVLELMDKGTEELLSFDFGKKTTGQEEVDPMAKFVVQSLVADHGRTYYDARYAYILVGRSYQRSFSSWYEAGAGDRHGKTMPKPSDFEAELDKRFGINMRCSVAKRSKRKKFRTSDMPRSADQERAEFIRRNGRSAYAPLADTISPGHWDVFTPCNDLLLRNLRVVLGIVGNREWTWDMTTGFLYFRSDHVSRHVQHALSRPTVKEYPGTGKVYLPMQNWPFPLYVCFIPKLGGYSVGSSGGKGKRKDRYANVEFGCRPSMKLMDDNDRINRRGLVIPNAAFTMNSGGNLVFLFKGQAVLLEAKGGKKFTVEEGGRMKGGNWVEYGGMPFGIDRLSEATILRAKEMSTSWKGQILSQTYTWFYRSDANEAIKNPATLYTPGKAFLSRRCVNELLDI